MNKKSFMEQFNTMLAVLKQKDMCAKEINVRTHVYYEHLKGIPGDIWAETVQHIILTHDFFPTIREICSAVGDAVMRREGRPQAEDAWLEVLEALRRGKSADCVSHPDIAKAVSAVGGWEVIGHASVRYELNDYREYFMGYYEQLAEDRRRSVIHPGPIPGAGRKVLPFHAQKVLSERRY